ncbi:hypothetical protein P168DRAFT_240099 [Aspergillus campestris IBT 28561]|uniref:DNA ligase D 3'-phosphoesterase domain-containing protein n=1 Tax=Aspergillus campestris (strain IBT 28561) TaxID=1392248 RepID=A0A2I1CWT0_ASPC2|nr:uncharacterized protein P168DRAFT_240099 [Aspergillus campestris IBT 28561]PKY02073.1 hypothetical protein P168DRAFT_240099 [Aspergillus campestris IBT 28561]
MKRSHQSHARSLSPQEQQGSRVLSSLHASVSPPRKRSTPAKQPHLAAIEAGQVQVTDHPAIISSRLTQCIRPFPPESPCLDVAAWLGLYRRNVHPRGRHFVVHQHDHPIAGVHYDLRLQFSETSSVSWSIMYGLPGDPNTRRLNRNATETRVHCLWNHLIETASARTGSMLIWDTGEYEILPHKMDLVGPETDDSGTDDSSVPASSPVDDRSESEKLFQAFHDRKIRLRLHGTRLPPNYTVTLRLDKASNIKGQSPRTPHKRRRRIPQSTRQASTPPPESSSLDSNTEDTQKLPDHSDDENDEVDTKIRAENAYPGSVNTIGSIHQRRWFLTLDRTNSGFKDEPGSGPAGKRWTRQLDANHQRMLGFEPFYVRGPEVERSIVTGRLGKEILEDEGVQGFLPRRGWRPILE